MHLHVPHDTNTAKASSIAAIMANVTTQHMCIHQAVMPSRQLYRRHNKGKISPLLIGASQKGL